MINKKTKTSRKFEKSDIFPIVALVLAMFIIFFSERNLTGILQLLLIVVLPSSLFLYWLDFKKQNR
ncbi:hypothetical protein [Vagococcus sp.]|uniref:hypothetical protein n=1 Tax=Vagococcus sp. TaxID=1933889 RepID=UPI002FC7B40F